MNLTWGMNAYHWLCTCPERLLLTVSDAPDTGDEYGVTYECNPR